MKQPLCDIKDRDTGDYLATVLKDRSYWWRESSRSFWWKDTAREAGPFESFADVVSDFKRSAKPGLRIYLARPEREE